LQLDEKVTQASANGPLKKAGAALGPVALILWKFKAILLGLAKITTLLTMFASFGIYLSLYGWAFALGLVLSIYVHEMGHVIELRRFWHTGGSAHVYSGPGGDYSVARSESAACPGFAHWVGGTNLRPGRSHLLCYRLPRQRSENLGGHRHYRCP
jgi:hypothetical protein